MVFASGRSTAPFAASWATKSGAGPGLHRGALARGRSAAEDGEHGFLASRGMTRAARQGKKVARSRCRPGPAPVRSPLSEARGAALLLRGTALGHLPRWRSNPC